jgi:hypothetical protein
MQCDRTSRVRFRASGVELSGFIGRYINLDEQMRETPRSNDHGAAKSGSAIDGTSTSYRRRTTRGAAAGAPQTNTPC